MAFNWTEAKVKKLAKLWGKNIPARDICLLYTSPSPRD